MLCVYVFMCLCVYVCVCMCVYVFMCCVCMYVCVVCGTPISSAGSLLLSTASGSRIFRCLPSYQQMELVLLEMVGPPSSFEELAGHADNPSNSALTRHDSDHVST